MTRTEHARPAIAGSSGLKSVALCVTGLLSQQKLPANALAAAARHLVSEVAAPWSADVFVAVEIGGSAEMAATHADARANRNCVCELRILSP